MVNGLSIVNQFACGKNCKGWAVRIIIKNIRTLTTVNQFNMILPVNLLHLLDRFSCPNIVTCHIAFAYGGGSDSQPD